MNKEVNFRRFLSNILKDKKVRSLFINDKKGNDIHVLNNLELGEIHYLLLECYENKLNADEEINYLYKTIDGNFLTDLQKEIKESMTGIQDLKLMAYDIVNSESFKEAIEN